jgi:D-lyxose ketol-isomerase
VRGGPSEDPWYAILNRSEINGLLTAAQKCFRERHWALPPRPRWDVTDFGLGDWRKHGLVLVNLATEPEYCEKLMYAQAGMVTPCHCHHRKKEDIICRFGELSVRAWPGHPTGCSEGRFDLHINGERREVIPGEPIPLRAGERVTLPPRVYHEFVPTSPECIIGEVSTANDDEHDNFFVDPNVGRFPLVVEDEPALWRLVTERD